MPREAIPSASTLPGDKPPAAVTLRPYQQQAVDAAYQYLREQDGHPVIVLPTGAGKSIVLAQIVRDAVTLWNGRVLLLTHVRELIEQNADKIRWLCPELNVGVYSAGLKRRDTTHSVICAGIQSVYERGCELGAFDLILVDEAHLISARDDSMYGQFLADMEVINPDHRLIGLTATPFRLDSGSICGPERIFARVCFEVGVRQLIAEGFLSPLISKAGIAKADTSQLHVRAGEFVASEVEAAMDDATLVEAACAEIVEVTKDRKSVLIFASGVQHGRHVCQVLQDKHGIDCGFVCGETPDGERDETLRRFRGESKGLFQQSPLKYLCNVNVLTTGFDAPNVDCVVLLRPTLSPGLFCLDSSTEILTESGWKGMGGIGLGERVAAFNAENEEIRYVPTLAVLERETVEDEQFVCLETPATSIRVTDRHRMVVGTRARSEWRIETAAQVADRRDGVFLPKAGVMDRPGAPLTDDELRFIGLVMTDGCLNRRTNAIHLVQSIHQPWIGELQRVIQSCGLKHGVLLRNRATQFSNSSTIAQWTISHGKPRGSHKHLRGWGHLEPWLSKDFSPRLLEEINAPQFRVLLEAIHLGDGAKQAGQEWQRRSFHIGTGNQIFAERLQICAITCGFRCTLTRSNHHARDFFYLHIKEGKRAHVASTFDGRPTWEIEPSANERVWCVENELGTLVTRRNGKVTIVGNCQMVGRGFRLHPGKANCLVLDYGGNVLRHGPVDQLQVVEKRGDGDGPAPAKECPNCRALIAPAYSICPQCGHEFPPPERKKHEVQASNAGVLSGQVSDAEFEVRDVTYSVHTKKDAAEDAPKTLRVDYRLGLDYWVSEWICFEHTGWARRKAEQWWQARSPDPCPDTAQRACDLAENGALAHTESVTVRSVAGEKFDRIHGCKLGPKPEPSPIWAEVDLNDVPF